MLLRKKCKESYRIFTPISEIKTFFNNSSFSKKIEMFSRDCINEFLQIETSKLQENTDLSSLKYQQRHLNCIIVL
jgi:hypothetical protein